jgi:hypothetical protein
VTVAVVGVLVALGARDTKSTGPARPAPRGRVVYTLRWGDVVRDPRTGTRCDATGEAGIPNLFCTHTARGLRPDGADILVQVVGADALVAPT